MTFKGSMVAIVTPFKGGRVDEDKLSELVRWHIKKGTSAIVPCGTTGESATLSWAEHERVIEITIDAAAGRVPVIAGTGSNSTDEAVMLTQHAQKAGAAASLQITPYYNKPTQKGIYEHFKAVAKSVTIPLILYNIASRTGVNILPETIAALAKDCKNIVGVKEASGNLEQMSKIKLLCGDKFNLISGDDALTLPLMAVGGTGVISVVANIVPEMTAKLCNLALKGKFTQARDIHYKLLPLVKAMFIETNPGPLKTAMGLMGLCSPTLRLPMASMEKANLAKLKTTLKAYKLI